MTNDLKPCPFCGRKPIRLSIGILNHYYVACCNDKCRIQPMTDAHKNKTVVTREWNRRASDD